MKLKKIVSILCVLVMTIALGTMTVSADETGVGDVLGINNDNSNFSDLVSVENGKTYLPLRLIFPNLNDKENRIGFKIDWEAWEQDYSCVRLIHGATSGEGYIKLEDGKTMTPFVGNRKCVDIVWEGSASEGAKAYLTVIEYTYDETGEMKILKHDDSKVLDDLIYLKKVDGGDRMFVSINDINKLSEFLEIDGSYKVKLYK